MDASPTAQTAEEGRFPYPVLLLISTAYIAVLLNIQGFVAMMPLVQSEFGITRAQAGLYSSFYFFSATLVAVFAGRLSDRLGARRGMAAGCCAVGIMIVLHGAAPVFSWILGLALVTGVGFSLITPSVTSAVIENVSSKRRAGAMGVAHGVGGTGALIGTMALPALGERYGWRPVMVVAGLAAVAIGLFIMATYGRLSVPRSGDDGGSADAAAASFGAQLRELLSRRAFVCACVMGIAFGLAIASITGHFTLFMHRDLGYSPTLAGFALGAFHVGGILGQPTWGVINDRLYHGRRHAGLFTLSVLTASLSLVFGLVVARGLVPYPGIVALSALLGFFVLGTPGLFFTTVTEIAPSGGAGVATGVALMFSRVGVMVAPPVFGHIADVTGVYATSWVVLAVASVVVSGGAMTVLCARGDARSGR